MSSTTFEKPTQIIGIQIRTSNDNGQAATDIPPQWGRFFQDGIMSQIPNKVSGIVYAIYTEFENEGQSADGMYSFIIGAEVSSLDEIPDGFVSTVLPASDYRTFDVEAGKPETVGARWMEIWAHEFERPRTFVAEFERYHEDGQIDIQVGVK